MGLGFSEEGKIVWKKVSTLVGKVCGTEMEKGAKFTERGKTVSELVMEIVKLNPGTILRLSANNGILPCMSIDIGERNPEDLVLPKGVELVLPKDEASKGGFIAATYTERSDTPRVSILEIEK